METASYVLSFRMVFFYLVTTGWIFGISLCENTINQSIIYICVTIHKYIAAILSTCQLDTKSGCGKKRRILIGLW